MVGADVALEDFPFALGYGILNMGIPYPKEVLLP
jgi:hypothetical protein